MRQLTVAAFLLLSPLTPAMAQVTIEFNLPGVSIGVVQSAYPALVQVPGYPVYYDPGAPENYFFYDGYYWVYQGDNWYSSAWYDGPWALMAPQSVPLFILRVPVRYYRRPPSYFGGWSREAPPRWGEHWGPAWERERSGWDHWDRHRAPPPAPLPTYQRQYSGQRYPSPEAQHALRDRNYRYQPRDPAVKQLRPARPPPAAPPRAAAPSRPERPAHSAEPARPAREAQQPSGPARHDGAEGARTQPQQHAPPPAQPPQQRPQRPARPEARPAAQEKGDRHPQGGKADAKTAPGKGQGRDDNRGDDRTGKRRERQRRTSLAMTVQSRWPAPWAMNRSNSPAAAAMTVRGRGAPAAPSSMRRASLRAMASSQEGFVPSQPTMRWRRAGSEVPGLKKSRSPAASAWGMPSWRARVSMSTRPVVTAMRKGCRGASCRRPGPGRARARRASPVMGRSAGARAARRAGSPGDQHDAGGVEGLLRAMKTGACW